MKDCVDPTADKRPSCKEILVYVPSYSLYSFYLILIS